MVRLKNIKKSSTVIECDIIPEDSLLSGHIVVNVQSGTVEKYTLPEGYEWCNNHINHSKIKLMELSDQDNIPDEKLVMWC